MKNVMVQTPWYEEQWAAEGLVDMPAIKWQPRATEQQARVAVVGCGGVDDDVDAGDHVGRVASAGNSRVSMCFFAALSRNPSPLFPRRLN